MAFHYEKLKVLRKAKHMSQMELAKTLGVGKSTIGMYESGQRTPEFKTLEAICDFFNISMTELSDNLSTNGRSNINIGTNNGAVSGSGNATYINNTSAEQCELLSFLAKKFDIPELKRIKIDFATGSILAGGRKISDLTNPTIALCLQALSQELSRAAKEHNNKIDFVIE